MSDTNSNTINNSNYNWHIVSTYLQNILSGITNPKKLHVIVRKILKLWGEKAIAGIAMFLSCGV